MFSKTLLIITLLKLQTENKTSKMYDKISKYYSDFSPFYSISKLNIILNILLDILTIPK